MELTERPGLRPVTARDVQLTLFALIRWTERVEPEVSCIDAPQFVADAIEANNRIPIRSPKGAVCLWHEGYAILPYPRPEYVRVTTVLPKGQRPDTERWA